MILIPLLSSLLFTAEAGELPFQLWAEDLLVKIFPDTPPGKSTCVQVSCARREYQSGQFAITACKPLEDVTVRLSDLVHESGTTLPRESVQWHVVGLRNQSASGHGGRSGGSGRRARLQLRSFPGRRRRRIRSRQPDRERRERALGHG